MQSQTNIATIYQELSRDVFRFAMFKLRNREHAEDVTSETFARLLSHSDLAAIRNMKVWCIGIARNVIYEKYREIGKTVPVLESDLLNSNMQVADLDSTSLSQEMLTMIIRSLEELDSETKEIIVLKTWEELKFEEIADILKMTTNTTKTKYYRGIEKLKENINRSRIKSGNKTKDVRAISTPILLAALLQLGNADEFIPSPEFLESLRNNLSSSNLINSSQSMNKQMLKSKKFLAALAAVALVSVVGLAAVTIQLVNQSTSSTEPVPQVPPVGVNPTTPVEPVYQPQIPASWTVTSYDKCKVGLATPPKAEPYITEQAYSGGVVTHFWQFNDNVASSTPISEVSQDIAWLAYSPDNGLGGDYFLFVSVNCEPTTMSLSDIEAFLQGKADQFTASIEITEKWGKEVVKVRNTGAGESDSYYFLHDGLVVVIGNPIMSADDNYFGRKPGVNTPLETQQQILDNIVLQ